jgi:hypothetical protein
VSPERPTVDPETYDEARAAIRTRLQASVTEIDAHEMVCEELYQRFEHYSWVGIYVVEGDELVLSAWAGEEETEHTTIKVGEGICGLAAATGRTELVPTSRSARSSSPASRRRGPRSWSRSSAPAASWGRSTSIRTGWTRSTTGIASCSRTWPRASLGS